MGYRNYVGTKIRSFVDERNVAELVRILNSTCRYDKTGLIEPRSARDLMLYVQAALHPDASRNLKTLVGKTVLVYTAANR